MEIKVICPQCQGFPCGSPARPCPLCQDAGSCRDGLPLGDVLAWLIAQVIRLERRKENKAP